MVFVAPGKVGMETLLDQQKDAGLLRGAPLYYDPDPKRPVYTHLGAVKAGMGSLFRCSLWSGIKRTWKFKGPTNKGDAFQLGGVFFFDGVSESPVFKQLQLKQEEMPRSEGLIAAVEAWGAERGSFVSPSINLNFQSERSE
jgi:hypothetical protein